MKGKRLETIKNLVTREVVQNQEDLQRMLQEHGIVVTQATLSRDLRELGIVKTHDVNRGYCYSLPGFEKVLRVVPNKARFTIETIKSVEFSGNQAVIKTYPGFAGAVASIIDDNVHGGIMGTLAGDDVVLLILRDNADYLQIVNDISRFIVGFKAKLISKV